VAEVVVAAGSKAVNIELVRSLEVEGKVRTRRAEKALGEDLAVTVVGQPIREAAAATAAPINPDGTFTLDDLAESESLIYATTQNGWISWPFLTGDQPPGALQPSLTLREGGLMVLEGRDDSMWTRFELRGARSWMTRFYLGPKETRRVTVPAGEIEVVATACRRKPSDTPGIDLSSKGLVRVSRGDMADLTGTDAMSWKESAGHSMAAIVLLSGAKPLKAESAAAALASAFPGSVGSSLTNGTEGQSDSDMVAALELDSGHILGFADLSAPIPMEEAIQGATASPYWPNGGEEAATHQSALLVTCSGGSPDHVKMALELTQAVRAALDLAGERALGVLWGRGPAATNVELFRKLTEEASPESLPLLVWVRFQMVLVEGSTNRGIYTSGLAAFGLMEIEIPPCETPYVEVFDMAYGIAQYLVSEGPVIADGDTVGGTAEERIQVTFGPSMLDESRDVYRINLK
jgi:hypothetical protein